MKSIEKFNKYRLQIVLTITILIGFLLRIKDLSFWNLSSDEAFCVRVAGLNYIEIVKESILDVHPPFYYFLLHNWMSLFGNSEYSARSFSVLFGILSLYLIYLLGSLLFNRRVGIISSIILSVNVFNIDYSQKARMYTLLLFLSLLSVYLYLNVLKKLKSEDCRRYYYGLFIINIFLLYTHIFGLFVVLAEFSWLFFVYIKNRKLSDLRNIFLALSASFAIFTPWLFIIARAKAERSEPWLDIPNLFEIVSSFSGNNYLLILVFPFFALPLFWKKVRKESVIFSYALLFFTIIIPYLISILYYPSFQGRYIIFSSAIFYILIAYTFNIIKSNSIKINLAIWFIALSFLALSEYYNGPDNADWRSASAYIDQQVGNNDLLIFTAGYTIKNGFNYYSHRNNLNKLPFPKRSERISRDVDENNILELDLPLSKGYSNIWVIYHEHRDYNDLIIKKLGDYGYEYLENKDLNGIQIFKFVKLKQ